MNREFETIRAEDRGEGLVLLTLNRPHVANALNTQMGRDLLAFFDAINAGPAQARCIVLTGAGERAFCAGGDLKERNGMTDEQWQDQHLLFERMVRAFLGCPVPAGNSRHFAGHGKSVRLACAAVGSHGAVRPLGYHAKTFWQAAEEKVTPLRSQAISRLLAMATRWV